VLVAVLDSATPAVTAALAEVTATGFAVRAERTTVDARAHGELLAPQLDDVLREAGAKPRDLVAVVAGVGPGPFTGLRVGLVTAAALGDVLGIPTYGVCSLDALGWGSAQVTLVATDARRREIYWAVYDGGGARRTDPDVHRPADVAERLAEFGVERAVGQGAAMYADVLGVPVADEPRYPPAAALAALSADRVRAAALGERLTPLYLRRPDAVPRSQ